MINLHETGWHEEGQVAGWEHRYSSHMKNANVYAEVARWVNGDYTETTSSFFSDIDHDGGEELVIHNDKAFFVFEGIGGKANWIFSKNVGKPLPCHECVCSDGFADHQKL